MVRMVLIMYLWRFIWLYKPMGAHYLTQTYPKASMWARAVGLLVFCNHEIKKGQPTTLHMFSACCT